MPIPTVSSWGTPVKFTSVSGVSSAALTGLTLPVGTLVFIGIVDASTAAAGSLADSAGNVWLKSPYLYSSITGAHGYVSISYSVITNPLIGGTITFTAGTPGDTCSIAGGYITGQDGITFVDTSDYGLTNPTTTTRAPDLVNQGTTYINELVFAVIGTSKSASTVIQSSGWADLGTVAASTTYNGLACGIDIIQINSGDSIVVNYEPTFGANLYLAGMTVSFIPASSITANMSATNIVTGPLSIGSPTVGIGGAQNINVGSPSFSTPAMSQTNVFTAVGITTGSPSFAAPSFNQSALLMSSNLTTGSPSLPVPSLLNFEVLYAAVFSTGPPSFQAPTLQSIDNFATPGLTTGAASIGAPTLNQVDHLTSTSIAVGSPVFSAPVFAAPQFVSLGSATSTTGATVSMSGLNIPSGAHILVFVFEYTSSASFGSVADNNGAFVLDPNSAQNPDGATAYGTIGLCYRLSSPAVPSDTITYTKVTSGARCVMSVGYVTGVKNVAPSVSISTVGYSTAVSISTGVIPDANTALVAGISIAQPGTLTDSGNIAHEGEPFSDATIASYVSIHGASLFSMDTSSKTYAGTISSTRRWAAFIIGWPFAQITVPMPITTGAPVFSATSLTVYNVLSSVGVSIGSLDFSNSDPIYAGTAYCAPQGFVTGSPTIGVPTLNQNCNLSQGPFGLQLGSPTLGTPTFFASASKANFTGISFSVGSPSFSAPTLTIGDEPSSIVTGSPAIDVPSLGVGSVLSASALATGSPTIGALSLLNMTVNLGAGAAITLGSPAFGSPVFGYVLNLTAAPLAVGSPFIDVPAFNQAQSTAALPLVAGSPSIPAPMFGSGVGTNCIPMGFAAGFPTLGMPLCQIPSTLASNGVVVGSPTFSAPIVQWAEGVTPQALAIGSPVISAPSINLLHYLPSVAISTSPLDFSAAEPTMTTAAMPPLVTIGITAGNPAFTAPSAAVYASLASSRLTTSSPILSSPTLAQRNSLGTFPFQTAAAAIGAPLLESTTTTVGLTTSSPSFSAPYIVTFSALVARNLETSPAVFGPPYFPFPSIYENNVLVSVGFGISPLFMGQPLLAHATYLGTADGLSTHSPTFTAPVLEISSILAPWPILSVAPLEIDTPSLSIIVPVSATSLTTGALDLGAMPAFDCFSSNPEIICLTDLDDPDSMTGIFSNCNADFILEVMPLSLAGRTDPGIGPVQQITVVPPLVIANQTLYLDMTLLTAMGESLDQMAQNEIADIASVGATEAADIAAVQLKEASDVAYLEASIAALSASLTASFSAQVTLLQQQVSFLMQQASLGKGATNLYTGRPVFGVPEITTTGPTALTTGSPVFGPPPTLENTGPMWLTTGSPAIGVPTFTTTGPMPITTGSPEIGAAYLTRYWYNPPQSLVLGSASISTGSPEIGSPLITGLNVAKQPWPKFTQFGGGNVQTGLDGATSVSNLNVPAGALVLLATVSGDGGKTKGADEGSFEDTSGNVYELVAANYTPYYGTTSIFYAVLTEPLVDGMITYSATSNCAFGGGFFTGSKLSPLDIATVVTAGTSGAGGALPPKSITSGIPTEAQEVFFSVCSLTASSSKISEVALPSGWNTACLSTPIDGFLYGLIVGYTTNNAVSAETFTPNYGGSIGAAMCIAGFKKA